VVGAGAFHQRHGTRKRAAITGKDAVGQRGVLDHGTFVIVENHAPVARRALRL
jgi:hypothetical protein